MRLILFFTLISFAAFMFVSHEEKKSVSVVRKVTPGKQISSVNISPKSPELTSIHDEAETVRLTESFWDEVQERWSIDFQELLTRLDPERAEELYHRYQVAKKAHIAEVTRIIRSRDEHGISKEKIRVLMNKADEEYGEILISIFGRNMYEEITSYRRTFEEEIQNLNNDDYEIGIDL